MLARLAGLFLAEAGEQRAVAANTLPLLGQDHRAAAGMSVADLVKVNIFVTSAEYVAASRAIRDAALKGAEPASTFLVVAALAHPELVVEIEAVAAKA